jgi:hypothetical protein
VAGATPISIPLDVQRTDDLADATLVVSAREWTLPAAWTVTLTDTRGTPDPSDDETLAFAPNRTYAFPAPDTPGATDRLVLTVDPSGAPLPVELASFTGAADGESIRLEWQTASETNNAGFDIQRLVQTTPSSSVPSGPVQTSRRDASAQSPTSQAKWETVGFVDGAGTTPEAQTYRFRDANLPFAAEQVTYRLKQIDTDGTTTLTDPVTVERPAVTELQLRKTFPNPATEQVTVQFAVPEAGDLQERRVTLRLYDMLGRQVREVVAGGKRGRSELHLNVSDLASGMYFVRLQAGDDVRTRKLTVVR